MLRAHGSRRRVATFVLLVGLSLAMLAVSGSAPVRELRRGVIFAVSPLQGVLSDGTRSVTQVLGAFGEIDTLRRERQDLQTQVDGLEDEVAALEYLRDENKRLARQLKTKNQIDHETVVGHVTQRLSTQFERLITLDVGEEAGVRSNAPVLSDGGALVGTVSEVGDGWSTVQLISDTRSLVVGLVVNRTRATGLATGRLASPLAMGDTKVTDKVRVGDRVVTAGIEIKRFKSLYPKGLPVGRVLDVQLEPGAMVQTALIEPSADLERIEDVLVITDFRPPRRRPQEATE
ncbi:MAG: rod shape-determining protein MreC [Chloroflexota bacterium]